MKFKKVVSFLLTVVMLGVACIPSYASMNDEEEYNEDLTSLFYEADDDEIVVYYQGQPVQKKDIIVKTGEIKRNRIEEIKEINKDLEKIEIDLHEVEADIQPSATLPSPYTEAVVVKVLSAPGFSQETTDHYLTEETGKELARTLDFDLKEGFVWLLAGFIPVIGPAVSVGGFFISARDADLASKIRDQTDRGYDVVWSCARNQYGTFHGADYWNGRTIDLSVTNNDTVKEKIESIAYR